VMIFIINRFFLGYISYLDLKEKFGEMNLLNKNELDVLVT